uniref:Reverse transcriptase domain-containing protein n=2 Tax=Graphocephala atropunctata TaxID=36148 RepID=A0A1B6KWH1_9HEMI
MINRKRIYDQKLRTLHRQANSKHIEESDNKTKALWSLINNERRGKQCKQECPKLNINNTTLHNPAEVAESFNTYFTQIADMTIQNQINTLAPGWTGENPNLLNIPMPQSFCMTPTTWTEVNQTIRSLKNKSSSGIDEFSSKSVKLCANELTRPLVAIINKSFVDGHFPSRLKVSKVYPKHKTGKKSDPQNYRPISLISTFAKIIEKLVLKRLMVYLKHHNLITVNQHGFQKEKSTISAIISLVESIIDSIEDEKYVTALFLDYSKAFDCLGHDLILKKLENLGVRGIENKWFSSYLRGRSQLVEVQHTESCITRSYTSAPKPIARGVPQGSVLGPVLFILLTNDFPTFIDSPSTDCIMYADDTTLLIKNDTADELSLNSLTSLQRAIKYSALNDLAINPKNTTQVHFSRKN